MTPCTFQLVANSDHSNIAFRDNSTVKYQLDTIKFAVYERPIINYSRHSANRSTSHLDPFNRISSFGLDGGHCRRSVSDNLRSPVNVGWALGLLTNSFNSLNELLTSTSKTFTRRTSLISLLTLLSELKPIENINTHWELRQLKWFQFRLQIRTHSSTTKIAHWKSEAIFATQTKSWRRMTVSIILKFLTGRPLLIVEFNYWVCSKFESNLFCDQTLIVNFTLWSSNTSKRSSWFVKGNYERFHIMEWFH